MSLEPRCRIVRIGCSGTLNSTQSADGEHCLWLRTWTWTSSGIDVDMSMSIFLPLALSLSCLRTEYRTVSDPYRPKVNALAD